jgi:ketosteroid isomerase-like protein
MNNCWNLGGAAKTLRLFRWTVAALTLCLSISWPATAQQPKDKKNKKEPSLADSSGHILPMKDEEQIDYLISEMLGAWQINDIDRLHKDYADDVTFVNGGWAPPIIGWNNYLPLYQQQRARMQQVRMDRTNTYIKVEGNFGWACYQWDFSATVDSQPVTSQGQTTLVLAKRNNRWVIVHNHTSLAQAPPPPGAQPPSQPPPTKPS